MGSETHEGPRIVERVPRREWLLRCSGSDEELGICSIDVYAGRIEVVGPGNEIFSLDGPEIIAFRSALEEAITVAENDLAGR